MRDVRTLPQPSVGNLLAACVIGLMATHANASTSSCPDIPLIRYDAGPAASMVACDPLNRFQFVPLRDSESSHFSFGGEIRERYERTNNPGFGADPEDSHGVWLQRFALHGDLHAGERWRFFAELHSVLENGREAGPGPTDENRLDLQNAFVEGRFAPVGGAEVQVRVGRQELQLGSARLISVRDGPNVRRTFDGIRVIADVGSWGVNLLAVRPREDEHGVFDDSTSDSQGLWGIYATRSLGLDDERGIDIYFLGYRNDDAAYEQGGASERRHTIGARLFGSKGAWDWNFEPMIQFGEFGGADLRAWTIASETGYSWSGVGWQPRLMLSANIASGDRNPEVAELETFNPMYPRGNYFSEDASFWPQNFFNAHLFLTLHPATAWALTVDYNSFWRMSRDDAVYGPNGSVLRSASGSDERFVATALSFTSEWSISRQLSFTAIYTHVAPRTFLKETGPAEELDFLELTARYRF